MAKHDFKTLPDAELIAAARDERLGIARGLAIEALADRALANPELLPDACAVISNDRRIGFRTGPPLGWFGADRIYLSGQERAIRKLLEAMAGWDATEQADLVRHWAGKSGLAALSRELEQRYAFEPLYQTLA